MRTQNATPTPHRNLPWFTLFAQRVAHLAGKPATFIGACLLIAGWALTGPLFHYSNGWQLVINTGTTIVTFLMVFLIQNTQNRDSQAIHVKLDELIRAMHGARNSLLDLDSLSDEELEQLRHNYAKLAAKAQSRLDEGDRNPAPPARKN